jgi:serine/threonine protein phosphatase PrpC
MTSTALTRPTLLAAGASHAGLQRENNEDRFHCDPARGLFMVIDGVGGHAAGEKAAETALTMIRARLERETGSPADRLREAIALANNEIVRAAGAEPSWAGMACVLTAALVRDGRVTIGHVGDTRLYAFQGAAIAKATHDHSPIGEREDQGEIDEVEAMRHPRRNEIYRDVGSQPHDPDDEDFIEILDLPFDDDTALLLCTDGLSDMVPSQRLGRIVLENAADPAAAVERLIEAANEAGGKDNVTAVVVAGPRFAETARQALGAAGSADGGRRPGPPVSAAQAIRRALASRPALVACGVAAGLAGAAALLLLTDVVPDRLLQLSKPAAWSRTWRVGPDEEADAPTIQQALARAQPGDTVAVDPGTYDLPVVVPRGVALLSRRSREAVLRTPAGAAVHSPGVLVVGRSRIAGFKIDATGGVQFGVSVEEDEAVLEDLEVVGAGYAAVVFGSRSRGTLRASYLHDNDQLAIDVAPQALPRILHNVLAANGRPAPGGAAPPVAAGARAPWPAVRLEGGSSAEFFGNVIAGNGEDQVEGLAAERKADVLRDNVIGVPPRTAAPAKPPAAGTPARRH